MSIEEVATEMKKCLSNILKYAKEERQTKSGVIKLCLISELELQKIVKNRIRNNVDMIIKSEMLPTRLINRLKKETGYDNVLEARINISIFKGYYVVTVRIVLDEPDNDNKDKIKSYNCHKRKIFESYEVSRFTTIGLEHWHPMRKAPMKDNKITEILRDIYNYFYKPIISNILTIRKLQNEVDEDDINKFILSLKDYIKGKEELTEDDDFAFIG